MVFTDNRNFEETLHIVFFRLEFFSTTLEYSLLYRGVFKQEPQISTTRRDDLFALTTTMNCIHCENEETRVIETRQAGEELRRRRECSECEQRFTTYERVEMPPLRIIKKDGSRQLFNREKLKRGLIKSCEKRPVTEEQLRQAVSNIEQELRRKGEAEMPSKLVGDLTMRELQRLDEVAYIRFASVYKEFHDAQSFEKEIQVLAKGN